MTKTELFLKLAQPDENGISRWVGVSEFIGEYAELQLGNGGSWCRGSSTLAKLYKEELGCKGCYQYDPVEYRKTSVKKISKIAAKETADAIYRKLYPEDDEGKI